MTVNTSALPHLLPRLASAQIQVTQRALTFGLDDGVGHPEPRTGVVSFCVLTQAVLTVGGMRPGLEEQSCVLTHAQLCPFLSLTVGRDVEVSREQSRNRDWPPLSHG